MNHSLGTKRWSKVAAVQTKSFAYFRDAYSWWHFRLTTIAHLQATRRSRPYSPTDTLADTWIIIFQAKPRLEQAKEGERETHFRLGRFEDIIAIDWMVRLEWEELVRSVVGPFWSWMLSRAPRKLLHQSVFQHFPQAVNRESARCRKFGCLGGHFKVLFFLGFFIHTWLWFENQGSRLWHSSRDSEGEAKL